MISNFKTTLLFSVVQGTVLLSKLCINKAAAVFLGAHGLGVIGILQSLIELSKLVFTAGISHGATQIIAEADKNQLQNVQIQRISGIIISVSILGIFGTISLYVFSDYIADKIFDDETYASFIKLASFATFLLICTDTIHSILKGLRAKRYLALAMSIASVGTAIIAVPAYYFLGMDAIAIVMISNGGVSLVLSYYYLRKAFQPLSLLPIRIALKHAYEASKIGLYFCFVTVLTLLSDVVIKSYIASNFSLETAGQYQVGLILISGYFGVFIKAMMSDYYPALSGARTLSEIQIEFSNQIKSNIALIGPFLIFFIFALQYLIPILFDKSFLHSADYAYFATLGTFCIAISNPLDIILLVKRRFKAMIIFTILFRLLGVAMTIIMFKKFSMIGAGLAYMTMSIIHLVFMVKINFSYFKIRIEKKILPVIIFYFIILACSVMLAYQVENMPFTIFMIISFILSLFISFNILKKSKEVEF